MTNVALRVSPDATGRTFRTAVVARPATAAVARWVRRAHLFSGLLMLPFVLIYGVSAFLFNHAGGEAPATLPVAGGASDAWSPDANALAARVASELKWDEGSVDSAHCDGEWLFEFRDGDRSWRLSLPLDGRAPALRPMRSSARDDVRIATNVFAAEAAAAEAAARQVLEASGRAPRELRRIGAPSLRFDGPGGATNVSMQRGQVTTGGAFDFERLLMRLHTTHGYGGSHWARTVWAAIVDLMAAAMVLWTVSGVWMWWQKKSQRRIGGVVLAGGVFAAILLAVALAIQFG